MSELDNKAGSTIYCNSATLMQAATTGTVATTATNLRKSSNYSAASRSGGSSVTTAFDHHSNHHRHHLHHHHHHHHELKHHGSSSGGGVGGGEVIGNRGSRMSSHNSLYSDSQMPSQCRSRRTRDNSDSSSTKSTASSYGSTCTDSSCSGSESSSTSGEPNLPYPGFPEISMKYLRQDTRPRNWCLLLITNPWFERISILVILFNCITLGMYQPCVDDECVTNRCKILQVSVIHECLRA